MVELESIVVAGFAIYGFATLVWRIWRRLSDQKSHAGVPAVIVVVDHASDWIEWFVRKLSLEIFSQAHGPIEVLIVDKSASEEIGFIVTRLQRAYRFITYVPSSEQRCWTDVAALLGAAKRSQALFVELEDETDVRRAIRMIARLAP